jgi:hypothetical protein
MSKPTIKIVPENKRLNFIPKHLGNYGVIYFETFAQAFARKMDSQYDGGLWVFAETENSFFMYPSEERNYSAHSDFSMVNDLTNVEFGMLVSFLALDRIMWQKHNSGMDNDKTIEQWYNMKDMLLDQNADKLYPIID